ncbi:MAG: OmpP1/FadL family transporter [Janthinobacterium lividum]
MILTSACVCAGAAAPGLHAQGFYWNTASAKAMGLGGIYVPSSTSVLDAMSVNPAGLSELRRPVLEGAANAVFSRGTFSNIVNNRATMQTGPGVAPSGAFGIPLGHSRYTLGVFALPELTSVSNWAYVDAPGTAGASYGLQQNKSAIVALRSAVGLSARLGPRVSVGATLGATYNSNTLHSPYIFQTQPTVKGLKTLLDLRTSGFGVNSSAGILVRPGRRVQLGVGYRNATRITSTGVANGNLGVQLAAAGLGGARPDFRYDATVRNVLPQSISVHTLITLTPRLSLALGGEWVNWKRAFKTLSVDLKNGNNADVNGLLQSTSLHDDVPLDWKNQFPVRVGLERSLGESLVARAGYVHVNKAVPASTATPLTAAIFTDQVSAGGGYHKNNFSLDAAYTFVPTAMSRTGISKLQAGEYNHSAVGVGLQSVTLSTVFVF